MRQDGSYPDLCLGKGEAVNKRSITPEWIAGLTGGHLNPGVSPASQMHWDSRKILPETAFFALPGEKIHGREFGPAAVDAGAAFVITDAAHKGAVTVARPEHALITVGRALRDQFVDNVIAVGGSSGKTTAKECIAQGLGFPAPVGNLNNAPGLAQFFWNLDPSARGAVVELGIDRALEMAELTYLARPDVAVMTSIGPEHLDGLGNVDNVTREESWLLHTTPLRIASAQAQKMARVENVMTYGIEEGDFRATKVQYSPEGSKFVFGKVAIQLPYPGLGPVLGAVAALATAEILGIPAADVAERLAALTLPSGRMERTEIAGTVFINDAYNSNPLSFQSGMDFLKTQTGPKWLVLGRMAELGTDEKAFHLEAAKTAKQVSDQIIFVGPLAQQQAAEVDGIAAQTVDEAAEILKSKIKPGELVYLKASRSVGLERILSLFKGDTA